MNKKPIVSAIAAIGKNRELGKDGKLIWRIPEDMRYFKKITNNHPVIMGRKTYESIGKPLPNRVNIIITRNTDYRADGCIVVQTIEDAVNQAKKHDSEEIFIIGGGEIYNQSIGLTDKLYLTIVNEKAKADTYFPDYLSEGFRLIKKEDAVSNSNQGVGLSFHVYCK